MRAASRWLRSAARPAEVLLSGDDVSVRWTDWAEVVTAVFTTVGVVATLAVLAVTERRYRNDRQQERSDQARLVLLDFELDEGVLFDTNEEYVVFAVVNLSERPIFGVEIKLPEGSTLHLDYPYGEEPRNTGTTRAIDASKSLKAYYRPRTGKIDWKSLNNAYVQYMTANGARWRRTAEGEPVDITT